MSATNPKSTATPPPGRHLSEVPEQTIAREPLINAEAAATLLSVPASWVLAEARAGRIPHVRLGKYVRFDADELQAWWMTRRQGPWRARGAAAARATGSQPGAQRTEAA